MSFRSLVATGLAGLLLTTTLGVAPVWAADELAGEAAIRGKDTRRNTIQLGDLTVHLDEESVIRDANGTRVSLRALPVPDFGRGGKDLMLGSIVGRYVAVPKGSRRVLRTLDLFSMSD